MSGSVDKPVNECIQYVGECMYEGLLASASRSISKRMYIYAVVFFTHS